VPVANPATDRRQRLLPVAGNEGFGAARGHNPGPITLEGPGRHGVEQVCRDEWHVSRDREYAVGRRGRDRRGDRAEDANPIVAADRYPQIGESHFVVGHDENLVGHSPEFGQLAYDDGAPADNEPALVAAVEPARASARDEGGSRS